MRKTIVSVLVIATAVFTFASCKSDDHDAIHIDYEEYTLDNGLKVVLHEDHSDPIVA